MRLQLRNDAATLGISSWIEFDWIELIWEIDGVWVPQQLDLLEKKNSLFLGSELADVGVQKHCVNKTEGCLSQRENGIVGFFFCTFIELWVALILGNFFNVVWKEALFFFLWDFYDLSHVLMERPVYYLMLIAVYCAA